MSSPAKMALQARLRKETLKLLENHRLVDWRVNFDHDLGRAGTCRYGRKEIVYSMPFMECSSLEEQRNTVSHEVAHALAGPEVSHGEEWVSIHLSLGGTGHAITLMPEGLSSHKYFLWVGACNNCGYRTGLEEAPENIWICRACDVNLPATERLFSWTLDEDSVTPEAIGVKYAEQWKTLWEGKP